MEKHIYIYKYIYVYMYTHPHTHVVLSSSQCNKAAKIYAKAHTLEKIQQSYIHS